VDTIQKFIPSRLIPWEMCKGSSRRLARVQTEAWGCGNLVARGNGQRTTSLTSTPERFVQPQRKSTYDIHRQMSASSIHAEAPPDVVRDPEGLQYETGPQLGKGGFAICHRAKLLGHEHLGSSTVALKIVKSKMEPPKLAQKVQHA
jgi:hypothetical protein